MKEGDAFTRPEMTVNQGVWTCPVLERAPNQTAHAKLIMRNKLRCANGNRLLQSSDSTFRGINKESAGVSDNSDKSASCASDDDDQVLWTGWRVKVGFGVVIRARAGSRVRVGV